MIQKKSLAGIVLAGFLLGGGNLYAKGPFLIDEGLPHYTKTIMQMWDSEKLSLDDAQKKKLLKVRKETISAVKRLKPQIAQLQAKIVKAIKSGADPKELKNDVEKLSKLKAEATMVHLRCLHNTKSVLSKKQLDMLQ